MFIYEVIKKNIKLRTQFIVVIIFTILYWLVRKIETHYKIKSSETNKEVEPINLFDAFYFSLLTQTTVGYNNVLPRTILTRLTNIIQLMSILFIYI